MDYRTFRIRKESSKGRGGQGRKNVCQPDPRVSIVNEHKVRNLSGDRQSAGWGVVKTGRIYGWTWRNVVVDERERKRGDT